MNSETIKKFEAGLAEIKAMQSSDKKLGEWGQRTTGAHVLNLLHKIGVRVQVTTDPECDCVGGDTYYPLPSELQAVASELAHCPAPGTAGCRASEDILRDLVTVYADHPDFRKEWHSG